MKRQLMAEQWDTFARACLPINAPADQRREMRRAFYAGAQGILFKVIASLASDADPTTEDLELMENLQLEMSDVADAVKAGRA
ncbi:MAG: hypothetical protein E6Q97_37840 [Desulfurellales bacterium]|nr:MAG: hypothetical protein E6Q97_37840 [Desulfurellales bacterium]